ncbi:class I SAM-dependent methyltransferase [Ruminococcus gauvreauii]|uniref:Class I SAM-dependent methyltransferase n=1 Tax=Ruminococcus gauvreauii TaxID=438033 RepID=A0ABY5VG31_9FIRM|nr:class I SAM-dependent methyltransferase [Ruminococcus gauvreauii]UWP59544.1 class I SAM-dependent methyltransferase [Ruminococcus gauvreauii]
MFKELEEAWSQDSGGYDEMIKEQLADKKEVAYWMEELRQVLGNEPRDILDVGCGPGFLTIIMSRLGHRVKAIDGSGGMVRCAAGNFAAEGLDADVQVEDAVKLPEERKASYDVIISRDVVWTLYDPQKAFERWREVLRPEGRIIIYDGNYRRGQNSLKITAWKVLSQCLITVTERKIPRKAAHGEEEGVFTRLPMVMSERPDADLELLRGAGYKKIRITNDRYRNSPSRMEFWKYGYQGKKFRVIAWK